MSKSRVTELLQEHYTKTFRKYGPVPAGVDWGTDENAALLRQRIMLNVVRDRRRPFSLLDVGCGYGALLDEVNSQQLNAEYTGIDIVPDLVKSGELRHPSAKFVAGDIMTKQVPRHDYVVCNGILTQKLSTSILEMNKFCQSLVRRMFDLAIYGIAFNIMNTYVNFQKDNLYYRNPAEMMAWCAAELSPSVKIDCTYALWYEYTVYVYKNENPGN